MRSIECDDSTRQPRTANHLASHILPNQTHNAKENSTRAYPRSIELFVIASDMIFLVTNLEEDNEENKKQEMMNDLNPGNTITTLGVNYMN